MPYPSSHTNMANGTCNTPAAFIVSQNTPSLVDASPIVVKQTSFPLLDKCGNCFNNFTLRNNLEASANPKERGVCPAVGARLEVIFLRLTKSIQSPFLSTN